MLEDELSEQCDLFYREARESFERGVVLIVSRDDFDGACEDMERVYRNQFDELIRLNGEQSIALAEHNLVERFVVFLRGDHVSADASPRYVFDGDRGQSCSSAADAGAECRRVVLSVLEASLRENVRPRVSPAIVEEALSNFVRDTIEPHCRLVEAQWSDAKTIYDREKQGLANMKILEEKQRDNEIAFKKLQDEFLDTTNTLKEDIERRDVLQRRLEEESAELKNRQAELEENARRAKEEHEQLLEAQKEAFRKQEEKVMELYRMICRIEVK
jgi:hypothetical protein